MSQPMPVPPKPVRMPEEPPRRPVRRRWIAVVLVIAAVALWRWHARLGEGTAPAGGAHPAAPSVPVTAVPTRQGDLPVYLTGLGTVVAFNTVTVRSRVDGQIVRVAFTEGQLVHTGDLLVEIDPRPFEVQLAQAEGQLARDTALLKNARVTMERNRTLVDRNLIARQTLDDSVAQVGQYEGAVKLDQGVIENAKLQLVYAHVTAPIDGRVGLRLIDVGNIVHANDTNGLLVITQLQPITVVFTLPEDNLPPVLAKLTAGEHPTVDVYDRAGQTKIATGTLLTADNQIDPATGTTRLKAVFDNGEGTLFPNQFVNVRLLIDVRKGAILAPTAAIQRGPQGPFVYVVKADQTADVRPVTVGPVTGGDAVIETGLVADEQVVIDGMDKLRAGSPVRAQAPPTPGGAPAPGTAPRPGATPAPGAKPTG
jgi:membrane fusion protein, multidrug efflux system